MKWLKSVGTTTGAEHLQDGKACVYFEDLSDKNKRQYKLQKASWFHIGLRQTKCSLLTYCWIVKAKAIKEKKKKKEQNNLCSFRAPPPPPLWFLDILQQILFAMDDVKKSWLDLQFWKISSILLLCTWVLKKKKIKLSLWQKLEILL